VTVLAHLKFYSVYHALCETLAPQQITAH